MIAKLIPAFVKKFLLKNIELSYKANRLNVENAIPKVPLQQKHINNLKILLDRTQLLLLLPKNGTVAEIGVDRGDFSEMILNHTNPKKLHLVDAWGDEKRYSDNLKNLVANKFKTLIAQSTIEMNVGFSTNIIPVFADSYFDWVYLDTDHSYRLTKNELALLKNKIKPGGIIAGHDYSIGNWINGYRYGVIEAVHEFCVTENWEIIYLTMETDQFRSFAIRKL